MMIRFEENVSPENAQLVCQWSNSLDKSFQEQWMGTMILFSFSLLSDVFTGPKRAPLYDISENKENSNVQFIK